MRLNKQNKYLVLKKTTCEFLVEKALAIDKSENDSYLNLLSQLVENRCHIPAKFKELIADVDELKKQLAEEEERLLSNDIPF